MIIQLTPSFRVRGGQSQLEAQDLDAASIDLGGDQPRPDALDSHVLTDTTPAGQAEHVTPWLAAGWSLPDVEDLCAQIRLKHRQAVFAEKQRKSIELRLGAFLRVNYFGWSKDQSEAERAKRAKAAAALVDRVAKWVKASAKGKDGDRPAVDPEVEMLIVATLESSGSWRLMEDGLLKNMERLAKGLPGYQFVVDVPGFGLRSFARIIGETGALHLYASPAKVWKRLGLAVMDGERQRKYANVEMAAIHGYNPARRSVSWVAFEPILKHQPKDGNMPQRVDYDRKKVEYATRVYADGPNAGKAWPPIHCHRAASRYAEKRLIRDLWAAWRRDIGP